MAVAGLVGALSRDELEERARAAGAAGELIVLDVGNIRLGSALQGVMQVLVHRVRARLRDQDLIGHLGGDQLGVLVMGAPRSYTLALLDRLSEVFDEMVLLPDGDRRRLHGTAISVPAGEDVMWRAMRANAAAVEAAHRKIFNEGLWEAGGLSSAHTIEDVGRFCEVSFTMMQMQAFELVVEDVRIARSLCGPDPSGPPSGQVPIRAGGTTIGHAAWWYAEGAVQPEHPQYFSGLAAALSDAVARIRHTDALQSAATSDPLTGLLNRRGLDEAMSRVGGPYSVALVDIDDFKAVNSRLGHAGGDAVLAEVAMLLADSRAEDLVCRWGGEEFLIVLPGVTSEGAAARIERLLRRSMDEVTVEGRPVSFSCGVAASWPGADVSEVVRRADDGLRQAKQAGKAQVLVTQG